MSSISTVVGDSLYEMVISGGYKKGGSWGGEECAAYVSNDLHIKETVAWICLMVALYVALGFNEKWRHMKKIIQTELDSIVPRRNPLFRYLDVALGTLALCNWTLVLIYKINLHSLINLLQPCHIILLAQAFALLSNNSTGVILAMLGLPMVTGSGSALLFPDTSGLDQYLEEPAFWLQHYFIQSVPLYLLLRYDFLAARVFDLKTFLLGNWILVFTHWVLFEPVDYLFHVNVNFFLCPASAMQAAFDQLPKVLFLPTYRTFLMWSFVLICLPTAYAYVYAARFLNYVYDKLVKSSHHHHAKHTDTKHQTHSSASNNTSNSSNDNSRKTKNSSEMNDTHYIAASSTSTSTKSTYSNSSVRSNKQQ